MSSHHVIRENQEPALLVESFDALDLEFFGQILEWSPTIISNQENFDKFVAEGIKVDVLFSDNDNLLLQEHTKVIQIKNNFLEEALDFLIEHNHNAVNILASYIPNSLRDFASKINIVLFVEGKRFAYVSNTFEKWKPKNDTIYIDEKYLKSFHGLEYISKGVFKTVTDGFISIEFNIRDFVLIGEEI